MMLRAASQHVLCDHSLQSIALDHPESDDTLPIKSKLDPNLEPQCQTPIVFAWLSVICLSVMLSLHFQASCCLHTGVITCGTGAV